MAVLWRSPRLYFLSADRRNGNVWFYCGAGQNFDSSEPLQTALGLTAKEAEVLLWLAQGKSNFEIATILGNAEQTVKIHVNRVLEKLGVENRYAATVRALEILCMPRF